MEIQEIFAKAASIDKLISFNEKDIEKLKKIQIRPELYSRDRLFTSMMNGRIVLFDDLPISIKSKKGEENTMQELPGVIRKAFRKADKVKAQNGPSRVRRRSTVGEIMDKWERRRGIISVTDLHFRETAFEKQVEAGVLSDFNVYCLNDELINYLEMMTLVISSKGNTTDSHSDDSDGSNHCLAGQKLWLMWDRLQGKKAGLEDCTFDEVTTHASFSLKKFLSIPGARWLLISPGQTLFLPGNYTHRVITLENYIGFGSFHVALPSYIRSLRRWVLFGTTDVKDEFLKIINTEVIGLISRLKQSESEATVTYGLSYLQDSVSAWLNTENRAHKTKLLNNSLVQDFVAAAMS